MNAIERGIERLVFAARWILVPIYLGLIGVQLCYAAKFMQEFYHLLHGFMGMTEVIFMQMVLALIDIVMIANLITMVLIGGYATFVSNLEFNNHRDKPAWLDHIDPGALKIKLAGALVGISGVHLLKTFTKLGEAGKLDTASSGVTYDAVVLQAAIHLVFVISTLLLAWGELIMQRKLNLAHGLEHPSKPDAADAHSAHTVLKQTH